MKFSQYFLLTVFTVCEYSCANDKDQISQQIYLIDSTIEQKAKPKIFEIESKFYDPRYDFSSKIKATFFSEDKATETGDSLDFTLTSSYWWAKDTLFLFANLGHYSTQGMIAKIYHGKAEVAFENCHHENVNVYKLKPTDVARQCIPVPCPTYELIISQVPDTAAKQTIFGHINFKSDNFYYDHNGKSNSKRWQDGHEKLRVDASFYFRSNFKIQN